MKPKTYFFSIACCSFLFLSTSLFSQELQMAQQVKAGPAYVSYSLGKAPIANPGRQELSLYACDTVVTTHDWYWNNKKQLEWEVSNQVMSGLPFGWHERDGKKFYISKYYQASPPVFDTLNKGYDDQMVRAILGLVIPDQFTFFGERPVQKVFLDYQILEPVYVNPIQVDYNYPNKKEGTCAEQKLDVIPMNIQCKDFRWLNNGNSYGIIDGMGASGIARTKNDTINSQIAMVSYRPNGEDCLDCTVTILDDIMLNHDVYFVVDGNYSKTVSLTDFYKAHVKDKKNPGKIGLSCSIRDEHELPAGCREPGK